ncbi:MAG: DUF58 domain-containing protein, partial [Novosphingobium sp.]
MSAAFVLVPTQRAAILIALAAPLALLLAAVAPQAWIAAPAFGGAVLLVVLADGLLAGRLEQARLDVPAHVEVGEAAQIRFSASFSRGRPAMVEAALSLDPRLVADGRAAMSLREQDGGWQGMLPFTARRRGTGLVDHAWLRWTGPLGLGARQASRPFAEAVQVRPNIAQVRSPSLQAFLRDAQFGMIARRIRGEGSQFESLTDYQPGMDRRRIDWKRSARHAQLFAREY